MWNLHQWPNNILPRCYSAQAKTDTIWDQKTTTNKVKRIKII
jgi:hypothetical protein